MAGNATYTYDTLKSPDAADPFEADKYTQRLEDASKNIQRNVTGGPIVGLNRFQKDAAHSEAIANDIPRRIAAAENANRLAGTIDARLTGAANDLAQAEQKASDAQATSLQKQAQDMTTIDFDKQKALWELQNKRRDIDWDLEKNQTTRDDALENAWVKGIADDVMQELQISGAMKLQDIAQYYALQKNEVEQFFLDWQKKTETDWIAFQAKMVQSAEAFAALLSGAMGVATSFLTKKG
jgi:hypothetical protein